MDIKFVLDFDGVLFNSAFEAFTVANHATADDPTYRQDITYEEFLAYRTVVIDAWQYNRLYSLAHGLPAAAIRGFEPEEIDRDFARRFFAARDKIMSDPEWPKIMPAYDFFLLLKPLLLQHPDRFAVLSTRNVRSIRETLAFHGVDVVPVFGQEHIREFGSKVAIAREEHWLDPGRWLIVYVDDMNSHLEPFEGKIHLPLHADWGYDTDTPGSLSASQIYKIITSLLTLAKRDVA